MAFRLGLGAADTTLSGLRLGGQATPAGRANGPAVQVLPVPATEELIDARDRVLGHRHTLTFDARSAGPTAPAVRLLVGAVVEAARVVIDRPTTRRSAAPDVWPASPEATTPVTPSETGLPPAGPLVVGVAILLSLAGVSLLSWRARSSRDNPQAAAGDAQPPGWRQRAEQVHAEAGGDHATVLGLGGEIAAARERAAETLRSAGFSARCAAVVLAAVPIVVGAVRFLLDPAAPARFFEGPRQVVVLVAAAGLAAGGSRWLGRVARPPFRALSHHRGAHLERTAREEALTTVLDTAALYAAAGLPLQMATRRATEADDSGVAEEFFDLLDDSLRRRDGSIVGEEPQRFAVRCALALGDGMEPARAFFETASRVRLEQQWRILQQAEGFLIPMLLPVVVCVLPASLIVALGPW